MYQGMIAFIEAFGFQYHVVSIDHFEFETQRLRTMLYWAPAEAEAELAVMYKAHCIDAILTDDSDAVLFGGQTVI